MKIPTKIFLGIFLLLINAQFVSASHLVGGEIYYSCLGGNQYQVTLKLYRDCFCTNCAQFGFQEWISVFENNQLDQQVAFSFPTTGSDTLASSLSSACAQPSPVCVEEAIYTGVITLPPSVFGYELVYQRCCRNVMDNIPPSIGSTYTAFVPPNSVATCNSNPTFNLFPPIFICNNAQLIFNHSAVDPDGDSLVYSLCDPFQGADANCPNPSPGGGGFGCPTVPSTPPYTSVPWQAPFNAQNPLNNPSSMTNNLAIDPATGVLTGIPNNQGRYVVGVCVSEYRNGVLLGTISRDFQFNVVTCNIPLAGIPGQTNIDPLTSIGTYTVNCNNYTVNFANATTNGVFFHWDFGVPGLTNDTSILFQPSYTYADTGNYLVTLVASNGQGCSDTVNTWVRIFPTFDTDFQAMNVCIDSAVSFNDLSISSNGNVNTWRWLFGDGSASFSSNPSHVYSTPGTYSVNLQSTDDRGCVDNKTKTVVVHPLPDLNFDTDTICLNTPAVFSNLSTGNNVSYYWDFDDGTNSNFVNPVHSFSSAGVFNVMLTAITDKSCKDTLIQNVQVNTLPVIQLSSDTIICPNTPAPLFAAGGVSYNWQPSQDFANANIRNPVANPTSPKQYTVYVIDAIGCQASDSIMINFFTLPVIDAGMDTSVCLNPGSFRDSVGLLATGGVSYVWSPASGLDDPNIANPTSRPPFNITYYVVVTDTNNCESTDSVSVVFLDPQLNLIADTDTEMCIFDTIGISVLDQGLITSYSWQPGTGLSNPNIRLPEFFPQINTQYVLSVSNYCYVKSDTVNVIVHQLPVLNTGTLDSICVGENIQLMANGAVQYSWNPDIYLSDIFIADPVATPPATRTFYVSGIDSNGCENSDSITINVYPYPVTTTFISDPRNHICLGESVKLSSSGGYTYSWQADPTLAPANVPNPTVLPLDTTTYFVDVTNIHGCTTPDSVTVNVQHPVVISGDDSYEICAEDPVRLNIGGGLYYQWVPPDFLDFSNIPKPIANLDTSFAYVAIVSNDCFSDSLNVLINVNPLPIVDAGVDQTIFREQSAQLEVTGNGVYFLWIPHADLDFPLGSNPMATPFNSTQYVVRGVDMIGCINYDTVNVTVVPKTVILVPTGFTPDGDGMNDQFFILKHLNVEEIISFKVFNRWGIEVFSTNNFIDKWDGTYNGRDQNIGVYVWSIKYKTMDGFTPSPMTGTVTLIR